MSEQLRIEEQREAFNNKMSDLQREDRKEIEQILLTIIASFLAGITGLLFTSKDSFIDAIEKPFRYILLSFVVLIFCSFVSIILAKRHSIRAFEAAQLKFLSQEDQRSYLDETRYHRFLTTLYETSFILAFILIVVMIGLLLKIC
jgi:hypothetical protein